MGLFSNKEEEEKNEFGFIGASEWMNEQAKTAKAFNEEDDKMAGQNKPKAGSPLHSHRRQRQDRQRSDGYQDERPETFNQSTL